MPKKSAAGGGDACFRLAAIAGGSNIDSPLAPSAPFASAPASKTSILEGPSAALVGAGASRGGGAAAVVVFLGFGSMAASPVNGGDDGL